MVATLAHQVYTMDMAKNKSGGSGGKPITYVHHLQLPKQTVDHKDGASTLANNAPKRGLDPLMQQQNIIIRVETHGGFYMKGQLILQ